MQSVRLSLAVIGLSTAIAAAQQYVISTYAGGAPSLTEPAEATAVSVGSPISVATDEKGNVYFASPDLSAIFKLISGGVLPRGGGNSKTGYAGDGGPATEAQLNLGFGNASAPSAGVAVDKAGNLFV